MKNLLFLIFFLLLWTTALLHRQCGNNLCSVPLAIVKTLRSYESDDRDFLQYSKNELIVVYSYDNNGSILWEGKIDEGRQGFFLSNNTLTIKLLYHDNLMDIQEFNLNRKLENLDASVITPRINENDKIDEIDHINPNNSVSDVEALVNLEERNMGQESRRGPPPDHSENLIDSIKEINDLVELKLATSMNVNHSKENVIDKTEVMSEQQLNKTTNVKPSKSLSILISNNNFSFRRSIKSLFKSHYDNENKHDDYDSRSFLSPITEEKIGYNEPSTNYDYEQKESNENYVPEYGNAHEQEYDYAPEHPGNSFRKLDDSNMDEKLALQRPEESSTPNNFVNLEKVETNLDRTSYKPSGLDYARGEDNTVYKNTRNNEIEKKISSTENYDEREHFQVQGDFDESSTNNEKRSELPLLKSYDILETADNFNYSHLVDSLDTINLKLNKGSNNKGDGASDGPEAIIDNSGPTTFNQSFVNAPSPDEEIILKNTLNKTNLPNIYNNLKNESYGILEESHTTNSKPKYQEPIIDDIKQNSEEVDSIDTLLNYPQGANNHLSLKDLQKQTNSNEETKGLPESTPNQVETGLLVESSTSQDILDETTVNNMEMNAHNRIYVNSVDEPSSRKNLHPVIEENSPEDTPGVDYQHTPHISSNDGISRIQKYNICDPIKAKNGDIIHDPNCLKYMSDGLLLNDTLSDEEFLSAATDESIYYMGFMENMVHSMLDIFRNTLATLSRFTFKGAVQVGGDVGGGGQTNSIFHEGGAVCLGEGCNRSSSSSLLDKLLPDRLFHLRTFLIVLFATCGTFSFYMGMRKNINQTQSFNSEALTQAYEENKKLEDLTILNHTYELKISKLESLMTTKDDEINFLTANNSEYTELKSRLEFLEEENISLTKALIKLNGVEEDNDILKKQISDNQEIINLSSADLKKLKFESKTLSSDHSNLVKELENYKIVCDEKDVELEKIKQDFEIYKNKAETAEDQIREKERLVDSYETLLKKLNILKNSGFQNIKKRKKSGDQQTVSSNDEDLLTKTDLQGEWGIEESDNSTEILVESEEIVILDESTIKELLDSTLVFKEIEELKLQNLSLQTKVNKYEKEHGEFKASMNKKDIEINHFKSRATNLEASTKELEGKLAFISKYFEDKECKLQRNINDLMNECEKHKKHSQELESKLDFLRKQADVYLENLDESKKDYNDCQKEMRHRINELEDASNKLKITAHGFERKANYLQCENQNLRQTLNELEKNLEANTTALHNKGLLTMGENSSNKDKANSDTILPSDDNSSSSHASKQDKKLGKKLKLKQTAATSSLDNPPSLPSFPFFPPPLPPMAYNNTSNMAGNMQPQTNQMPQVSGNNMMFPGPIMPPFLMGPNNPFFGKVTKTDNQGHMTDSGIAAMKGALLGSTTQVKKKGKKAKNNTVEIDGTISKNGRAAGGHESDYSNSSVSALSAISGGATDGSHLMRNNVIFNKMAAAQPFLSPPGQAFFTSHRNETASEKDASFGDFSRLVSHSSPLLPESGNLQETRQQMIPTKKKNTAHPTQDRLV